MYVNEFAKSMLCCRAVRYLTNVDRRWNLNDMLNKRKITLNSVAPILHYFTEFDGFGGRTSQWLKIDL